MAADRDNPQGQPSLPAAQPAGAASAQAHDSAACTSASKPVHAVRRNGRRPAAFVLLFGMGLRSFSMSPAFIPTIKELRGHLTKTRAEAILRRAMQFKTFSEVRRYMGREIASWRRI